MLLFAFVEVSVCPTGLFCCVVVAVSGGLRFVLLLRRVGDIFAFAFNCVVVWAAVFVTGCLTAAVLFAFVVVAGLLLLIAKVEGCLEVAVLAPLLLLATFAGVEVGVGPVICLAVGLPVVLFSGVLLAAICGLLVCVPMRVPASVRAVSSSPS